MQTGRGPFSRAQRGYTLLGLLFLLGIASVLLLSAVDAHQQHSQREREAELVFRGEALSRAIDEYARLAPPGRAKWPSKMDDLLLDRRSAVAQRHLRRAYPDPFTGKVDWELIPAPDEPGGFVGVRSRATVIALRQRSLSAVPEPTGPQRSTVTGCVCEWTFVASRAVAAGRPSRKEPL